MNFGILHLYLWEKQNNATIFTDPATMKLASLAGSLSLIFKSAEYCLSVQPFNCSIWIIFNF